MAHEGPSVCGCASEDPMLSSGAPHRPLGNPIRRPPRGRAAQLKSSKLMLSLVT